MGRELLLTRQAISLSGVAVVKQESSARASGVSSAATVTPAVKTQEGGDDEDESLFGEFKARNSFCNPCTHLFIALVPNYTC